jgi:hypothetical protein
MDVIKIKGKELRLSAQPVIRCQYERGVYPLETGKPYVTPIYSTNISMRVEGVINGVMAEVLQFRGSFNYAGFTWHLIELETKVPNDNVEKQGVSDIEVFVTFAGGI